MARKNKGDFIRTTLALTGILLLLLLTTSIVVEAETDQQELATYQELSLGEAIERLEVYSTDLEIAELELSNAEVEYEKALAEQIRTESRLQKITAELSYEQAQQQYHSTTIASYLELLSDYRELQKMEQELAAAEWDLDLAEQKLQKTEDKVEAGYEPRIELLQRQIELNNAEFSLTDLKADYEQNQREFKSRLGLEEMPDLISTIESLTALTLPAEDEAVEKGLESSFELRAGELEIEIAEIELEQAEIGEEPRLEILEKENNLKLAELEQIKLEEEIIEDIKAQLHDTSQARRQIELAEANLEQAEEHLRTAREQYEAGLISEVEASEAELEKIQTEIDQAEAVTAFAAAYLELQDLLGAELEVIRDEILAAFGE